MSLFGLIRPLLFTLDPERAHGVTIAGLRLLDGAAPDKPDPRLVSTVAGIEFPNPVGLAPGFDKDAQVPHAMLGRGFGFVEVGTVTPRAQAGNPKPRVFRLTEDDAIVNRLGFNNQGQAAAFARLQNVQDRGGVIGVNIGANKDTEDRIADYVAGVIAMSPVASYLTINISSPNTPGLRNWQERGALAELLTAVTRARQPGGPPVFLKLAPDLTPKEIEDIAAVSVGRVDALIMGNTTVTRLATISPFAKEQGGLSGMPLAALAHIRLVAFRQVTRGAIPLIAAGGIDSAQEAYRRIRSGASLIQLYTALVYKGPGVVREINNGLLDYLDKDGFANISEAVGADAK